MRRAVKFVVKVGDCCIANAIFDHLGVSQILVGFNVKEHNEVHSSFFNTEITTSLALLAMVKLCRAGKRSVSPTSCSNGLDSSGMDVSDKWRRVLM
jgi:hypothetical protein